MVLDFLTHYYLHDRGPFLNVSDLDEPHVARVTAEPFRQCARQPIDGIGLMVIEGEAVRVVE